jgi:hypothetical protein
MGWIDMARRGAGRTEMAGVFPWFQAMDACAHDPVHHAEGSPWEHTARVVEALEADPTFRAMRPERQEVLRVAAWSHDQSERTQAPSKPLYWWGSPQGCPLSPGVTEPGHTP